MSELTRKAILGTYTAFGFGIGALVFLRRWAAYQMKSPKNQIR